MNKLVKNKVKFAILIGVLAFLVANIIPHKMLNQLENSVRYCFNQYLTGATYLII